MSSLCILLTQRSLMLVGVPLDFPIYVVIKIHRSSEGEVLFNFVPCCLISFNF